MSVVLGIQGGQVELVGSAVGALQTLEEVLRHLGANDRPAGPSVRIRIDVGEVGAPVHPACFGHLDVAGVEQGDEVLLSHASGEVRVRAEVAEARLVADDLPLHLATYLWANLLRRSGRYILHAGGVVSDGTGMLIVGPSGSGKSTLTLALLRRGARLLSDDSIVLAEGTAHAMRRGIFLEPAAARRTFPDLVDHWSPCPLVEASKQALDLERVLGTVQVGSCEPGLLVFPRVGHVEHSVVEPLPMESSFHRLVEQSRLAELPVGGAEAHLEAIARLARVPAVSAVLGGDMFVDIGPLASRLAASAGPAEGDVCVERRGEVVHVTLADGSGALVHLPTMDYVGLDPSACWLYARLGSPRRLVEELVQVHRLPPSDAAAMVDGFVADLGDLAP